MSNSEGCQRVRITIGLLVLIDPYFVTDSQERVRFP